MRVININGDIYGNNPPDIFSILAQYTNNSTKEIKVNRSIRLFMDIMVIRHSDIAISISEFNGNPQCVFNNIPIVVDGNVPLGEIWIK